MGKDVKDRADYFLDITTDVCPLTFVKAKLLIEKMSSGQTARIRLNSGEPLDNVPRAVEEHGHSVLSLVPEATDSTVYVLYIRKA